jgi:hypothetical protein
MLIDPDLEAEAPDGFGVDADSLIGAQLLYESVGMWDAHRFGVYEKRLP